MDRTKLKAAIVERLDATAAQHKVGHEQIHANRYVLRSAKGNPVEIMFEKGGTGNANLWVKTELVSSIPTGRIDQRKYLAKALNSKQNNRGKTVYGRHSGLRSMEQLGTADLTRFTLASVAELDQIIAVLRTA